ncbi:MAG: InlB B-repeat-containing protein [Coriobacteriales bacterium]|nr:InlB B-repeat-containing protein [Coriobacteriales bacterium]
MITVTLLLIAALFAPAAGYAEYIEQKEATPQAELHPLATGDIVIDQTTFPDRDFFLWAEKQSWGLDHVLTAVEAAAVTYINVNTLGVRDLTGIEYFPNIESLACYNNYYITEIDTSHNPKMTSIMAYGNPELSSVNVANNPLLQELLCSGGELTELDVSHNPELTYLSISNNRIRELDLSHNPRLTGLACSGNELTELDVTGNPMLSELMCGSNHLVTLDLSKNSEMLPVYVVFYRVQTSTATVFSPDDGTTRYVDLAAVVGAENLGNITSVTGGVLNPSTGLVALDTSTTDTLVYTYDVGYFYSTDDMDVTLTLTSSEAPLMNISFDAANGSAALTSTIPRGSLLTKPADPVKEGYRFAGWHTQDSEGNLTPWDFNSPVADHTTLVAKWEELTEEEPITEEPIIEDPIKEDPAKVGSAVESPADARATNAAPRLPATGGNGYLVGAGILALLAAASLAIGAGMRVRRR